MIIKLFVEGDTIIDKVNIDVSANQISEQICSAANDSTALKCTAANHSTALKCTAAKKTRQ